MRCCHFSHFLLSFATMEWKARHMCVCLLSPLLERIENRNSLLKNVVMHRFCVTQYCGISLCSKWNSRSVFRYSGLPLIEVIIQNSNEIKYVVSFRKKRNEKSPSIIRTKILQHCMKIEPSPLYCIILSVNHTLLHAWKKSGKCVCVEEDMITWCRHANNFISMGECEARRW